MQQILTGKTLNGGLLYPFWSNGRFFLPIGFNQDSYLGCFLPSFNRNTSEHVKLFIFETRQESAALQSTGKLNLGIEQWGGLKKGFIQYGMEIRS